jgi:teichuronic acid biosynthesis glycosyltransferase TuaC
MKVLAVSNFYAGNKGTFVHDQTKHVMRAGCEIKVIVPSPYCPGIIARLNEGKWRTYAETPMHNTVDMVPVYYPRYFRLPGKWFHPLSSYTEFLGLKNLADTIMSEFRPDVIHAHAATSAGFVGLLLKNRYGLPLICSIRGSDINTYPHYDKLSMYLTRKVISEADQIISVSAALKHTANQIAAPQKEIKVIYNGCDLDTFKFRKDDRGLIRRSLGIPEKDKIIVFVGAVRRSKGIAELLKAFKILCLRTSGLHLFIIGDGPERNLVDTFVDTHGAIGSVHQFGNLAHHDIVQYLNASDIFALPSHNEGLPNAVLEAMACMLPVVATKVGGIPEAVKEGATGHLIRKGDSDALADAIGALIRTGDRARAMGREGRRVIETYFQWSRNAEEVLKMYDGVVNTPGPLALKRACMQKESS